MLNLRTATPNVDRFESVHAITSAPCPRTRRPGADLGIKNPLLRAPDLAQLEAQLLDALETVQNALTNVRALAAGQGAGAAAAPTRGVRGRASGGAPVRADLMTATQIQDLLGISESTFRRWRKDGGVLAELRPVRLGAAARPRWQRDQVLALVRGAQAEVGEVAPDALAGFDLGRRARGALERLGVSTVEGLAKLNATRLGRLANCGEVTRAELLKAKTRAQELVEASTEGQEP